MSLNATSTSHFGMMTVVDLESIPRIAAPCKPAFVFRTAVQGLNTTYHMHDAGEGMPKRPRPYLEAAADG